jgi:hypothetical protein
VAGQAQSYVSTGPHEAPDITLWENGTLEQRKLFLGRLRETDPDEARSLLQDGFAQLDARERAGLLEAITTGIGPADEDFLETLLGDRSKEVRQLAASLLARLPSSRYLARMAGRMAACLKQERKPSRWFSMRLSSSATAGRTTGWNRPAPRAKAWGSAPGGSIRLHAPSPWPGGRHTPACRQPSSPSGR